MSIQLKPCPATGGGVHSWLFYAASRFVEAGLPNDVAEAEIQSLMTRAPNPPSEISDALGAARGERSEPSIAWPPVHGEQLEAIARNGMCLRDLCASSPFDVRIGESRTEEIIDIVFPGDPWLCVGTSAYVFATKTRQEWRGQLKNSALIVPSPMIDRTGLTKQGRESCHALSNTGPRKYLIIEADRGDLNQQSAVIKHLTSFAPLVAVVFSGSKSLHGWFACGSEPEDKLLRFMRYAVSLGADKNMWLPSQFCRMPDGRRSDRKRSEGLAQYGLSDAPHGQQTLLYLNPEVIS